MYDVRLRLIRKHVVDFLLVIIKPFSLGFTADRVRVNIDWISPFLKGMSHSGPKFQLEGDILHLSFCARLDRSENALQLCR